MKNSIIDFETYYDKETSVVTLGNTNYAAAADGYIVSLSIDGKAHCGTRAEMGEMCSQIAKDDTVRPVAANSNFDQEFWDKYFPKFKNPWHCLLDQGAYHQMPRNVANLAKAALGLSVNKSKRDEMKGKVYEELPEAEKIAVQEYCLTDVLVEAEIFDKLPPMSAFEEKVALYTRMTNRRGVKINTELVEADKTRLAAMRFEAFKNIPWHNDYAPLSYPALTKWCASKNIPVPKSTAKTNEECADLMSDHPELSYVLGEMRRFRKANTMATKAESLLVRTTPDGILPMDLLYRGAPHTGRWSSKGFNVQNLDKQPLTVTADGQTVWTRNWIIPRPGYTFLILDYAQIEPRCLNWLVNNEEMMVALRAGFSYYESYARAAKGWKGAAGTLKAEFGKERYTKLKNECLGCGYGMGATKYITYCQAVGDIVTEQQAKDIVAGFRKTNPKVVKFWGTLDNIISTAARDKSKHLGITLPSGFVLQYFGLRGMRGGYQGFTVKGDFGHSSLQPRLWGGTLCENVTQGMARDVLANAVINLEESGIPVVFTSHDEVILEIPLDSKEEARQHALKILQTPPEWAPDLPLGVEGDFADAYTK